MCSSQVFLNRIRTKVMTYGCFSKQCTSEIRRTLQTSTVYFSRVSYLFECNANDTYVLRMTHMSPDGRSRTSCQSSRRRTSAGRSEHSREDDWTRPHGRPGNSGLVITWLSFQTFFIFRRHSHEGYLKTFFLAAERHTQIRTRFSRRGRHIVASATKLTQGFRGRGARKITIGDKGSNTRAY